MPDDEDGVRCMLMRGGTSKGAYLLAEDLPSDPDMRDDLLLRIMGSPDPRQIDGIGGAHPLTSKVAVVSPSAEPGVDVDYLFLQVAVDEPVVSDAQTCGNLLAGIGPFAVERGLVPARSEESSVRIRLVNTGDVADETFATRQGRPVYSGTEAIDGVPGTASRVDIRIGGGSKPLLPTGNVVDVVDGVDMTLVDNGMPVVLLRAADLGVTGSEAPSDLEAVPGLDDRLESIRGRAGQLFGLGDVTDQTVPKMILLAPPAAGGAVTTRAFIPHRVHQALGVLMGASVAAGIQIPGAVGNDLAVLPSSGPIDVEHPTGAMPFDVVVARDKDGVWHGSSASVRTARKLFDGVVFPRAVA
jgi:4-oxalomesaconate tautomerase